jgi:hypothetical protein
MTCTEENRVRTERANDYAKVEDLYSSFAEGMIELYHPSLVMSADHQKAEQRFWKTLFYQTACLKNGVHADVFIVSAAGQKQIRKRRGSSRALMRMSHAGKS